MLKLQVFFVIAITLNVVLGMSFRHKRQAEDSENNLEDRYGWDRPQGPTWNQPWQQRPPRPQWNQANQGNQGGALPPIPDGNGGALPPIPDGNGGALPPIPNGNGATTQSPSVQQCMRQCPVTAEYNPVCGTNMVQYPNPGRLVCAQNCGVNVSLLRSSPCPTTTTAAPLS